MITQETINTLKQYDDFVDEVKAQISFFVKSLSQVYGLKLINNKDKLMVTLIKVISSSSTFKNQKHLTFEIDIVNKSIDDIMQEVARESKTF